MLPRDAIRDAKLPVRERFLDRFDFRLQRFPRGPLKSGPPEALDLFRGWPDSF